MEEGALSKRLVFLLFSRVFNIDKNYLASGSDLHDVIYDHFSVKLVLIECIQFSYIISFLCFQVLLSSERQVTLSI